jgi:catechol 2,3-dioxygenase-like lactoylglutathione lyase family enzyme
MKKMLLILSLFVLSPASPLWAQLQPPNEAGVTMGHVGLIVRNVEANKKFWTMLGGTAIKIDEIDVIKFPGVFVFLTPGNPNISALPSQQVLCSCPSDNVEPSIVNHLGLLVQNWEEYMERFKAAGLTMREMPFVGRRQIIIYTPDNVALEMAEGKSIPFPITQQHFHFFAPAYVPTMPHSVPAYAMYEWYAKMFAVKQLSANLGGELPGLNVRFGATPLLTAPTKGRPVDHIGFEVTNLEAFCKKLEANGVKFDQPYSKTRHRGFASADLTDPWGVSIELTEGLNKF